MTSRVVVFPGLSGLSSEIDPLLCVLRRQAVTEIAYPDWITIQREGIAVAEFLSRCREQMGSAENTSFFGYSFGGVVAFAIAADLLRTHRPAPVIGLLDTPVSSAYRNPPKPPLANRLIESIRTGTFSSRVHVRFAMAMLRLSSSRFGTRGFGPEAVSRTSRLGNALQCRYTQSILDELQRWMATIHTPLPLEAVLFRCVKQPADVPDDLGWRALIRDVRIIDIPGNHHEITQVSYAPILAKYMEQAGWFQRFGGAT